LVPTQPNLFAHRDDLRNVAIVAHVDHGKTTRIFRRVHSDYLYKAASKSSSSLRSAKTEPRLDSELRKLTYLAGTVSTDLKRLGHASKGQLPGLARELERVARTLE
jgi:hypothetical protein